MSDSRRVMTPRRTIVMVAAVTATVTVVGLRSLTGSGGFWDDCRALYEGVQPLWTLTLSEDRCVVVTGPAFVDSELTLAGTPDLVNEREVSRTLTTDILRAGAEIGTEGLAMAHFLVDETGNVRQRRIAESSGNEALDEALLAVGPLASFSPAETEDGPTEAWVAMTVGFATKQSRLQRLRETLERWRNQAET